MEALRRSGVEFIVSPGDGAFYGPKIEYTLKDALGRQWQCGTMQIDFNTAERLGAEYVTETSGEPIRSCCTAPSSAASSASSGCWWNTMPGRCPPGWHRCRCRC